MNMTFSELLNSLEQTAEQQSSVTVTENWMQGRTTYGGMSAALCYQAVINDFPDLPPLRSAQINFVGPAGGDVSVTTNVMRQGRSVAYISAEMIGEKGLATHAVFCFGEGRESRINQDFTDTPEVARVEQSSKFFGSTSGPSFANQYDCLLAQGGHPISGSDAHEHYIWVRHKDKNANNMAALIGIADMPPPAVLPMFKEFAPISSMTWMMNFIREDISTEDGWWLMRSAAEHARNGYSSQDMQVWSKAGDLVISARQSVAVFY
jgi:acyl-CoA thioesterase